MRSQSLWIASVVAIGLAMPASAQQSTATHRYVQLFKYTDQAIKAMTENPQDRAAQAAKLTEAFGGKIESFYLFPMGGEYDGMVISQLPSDAALAALASMLRSTGNFVKSTSFPLMTSEEFKAAMEKAKATATTYTAPTATR